MFSRLPISLAQLKSRKSSEKLKNEIRPVQKFTQTKSKTDFFSK